MHMWVRYCPRLHANVTLHMCISFQACEKLLSHTAAPLFPSHTPSQHNSLGPLAHMIAPHCSCLLLWARPDLPLKSKGGLPCPLRPFLLSIVDRQENTSPRLWLNPTVLGQNAGRQIVAKRKDGLSFFFFSLFPLFPPSWLISRVKPTVADSLEEVEVQPERCTWMKVTVQYVRADAVNGQRADSLSAVQKKPADAWPLFSWVHPFYKHVTNWCNKI